jgi:2'-5' RNA ligase
MKPDQAEPGAGVSGFLRLFIALEVPAEVCGEMARAQGQLRRNALPGAIRWTRPEQFHVTLRFLGDVPVNRLEALKTSVGAACAGFPAVRLSASGLGFFPGAERPRVIWCGAEDEAGRLADLHARLDEAVRSFAPAGKPERFAGHITLGRFKPGCHAVTPGLQERITRLRTRPFGGWQAGSVELVRSELTASGARYATVASFALK